MSVDAIRWAWRHSPYKGATFLVHVALADIANDGEDDELYMSQGWLAQKVRMERRTVNRSIAQLVEDGMLTLLQTDFRRGANLYRFERPDVPVVWGGTRDRTPESSDHTQGGITDPRGGETTDHTEHKGSNASGERKPERAALPLDVEPIPRSADRFDEFWRAYPKHVAKKQARAQWAVAIKRHDPQTLIDAAARYAIEKPPGSPYTLDPHRWLRDERWNDEPAPRARASGSTSQRSSTNLDRWYREQKERERREQEQLDERTAGEH